MTALVVTEPRSYFALECGAFSLISVLLIRKYCVHPQNTTLPPSCRCFRSAGPAWLVVPWELSLRSMEIWEHTHPTWSQRLVVWWGLCVK